MTRRQSLKSPPATKETPPEDPVIILSAKEEMDDLMNISDDEIMDIIPAPLAKVKGPTVSLSSLEELKVFRGRFFVSFHES